MKESVLLMAPLTCGLVPVQSTTMWPPVLRTGDEEADRLAVVDAVVVDPVLEAPFAVGQLLQCRPCQPLGVVDDLLEIELGLVRSIARDDLGELCFADMAGGELGAQVAERAGPAAGRSSR